ncbi:hypothetical protein [Hwanghaeella sp.]|uniref:hypothetical protein n=1 Tax=Hwanghaeella sp. TaxID=2605943 RepID=UPI003CCC2E60
MPLSETNASDIRYEQDNFTRAEASAYLFNKYRIPRSPNYLAVQAVQGGGPKFRRAGRNVIYARSDLDTYAEDQLSPAAATTAEHDQLSAA